ncbi:HAD-IA family hydrolase [Methylomonas koyamae]|uniref:Hydrolase n=1 Tax=Methylomonas koyamae TaxID=702114 RepID=A0A291IP97_9GAMM|nr:HAD-IA family hydrolase [Methylomonas koyamae]ATG92021.1 hydrolase [Methylomonas koyamae]OAI25449.1 hydrolase [Methylomonas koyamae]
MKNRFDLIIFDWDGTLMDSVDWIVHCIQQAAAECACDIPSAAAVKDIIGLSIDNATRQLFPGVDTETRQRLAEVYSKAFFSKQIGPTDLFPGVTAMLERLRGEGFRLAVATGKKRAGLDQAIRGTGVADLFCTTRSSDQTASKPDPLMVAEILAELGIDKQRALLVGDSSHDMQMAANAGVAAAGVTCGAHSRETLQQYKPLLCLDYPTDLLELL